MTIEAVIFDETQEFFIAQVIDDSKVSIYKCEEHDKVKKYDPLVQLMYDFERKFGRNVTCWEKMVEFNDRIIYAVRVDMEGIDTIIENSDEYMLISIDDINSIEEITKDTRWLVMMALDVKMRNKIIEDGEK